jgi:tRNA (adenine22-N1)-methyltransferase
LKLDKRLTKIDSMVEQEYQHIWDCCCDHGLLGQSLLERAVSAKIHFVDIVPNIMKQLETKLQDAFPLNTLSSADKAWQVYCIDVCDLPLQHLSGKHLVIIAGVGGDLMIKIIKRICQQHPDTNIDFLLCPVYHQYLLREQLIQLGFSLYKEALVAEKKHIYEVLLVSNKNNAHGKVTNIGQEIWQCKTPQDVKVATDYLNKIRMHYKRSSLNKAANVEHVIKAYEKVIIESP